MLFWLNFLGTPCGNFEPQHADYSVRFYLVGCEELNALYVTQPTNRTNPWRVALGTITWKSTIINEAELRGWLGCDIMG